MSGAAEKMNLSAPAMSRILGRIRRQFDDPIMVRAGKHLVPTPRALELKRQLGEIIEQATALIAPNESFEPGKLTRTFTIRANDIFIGALAGGLLETLRDMAPLSGLKFIAESDGEDDALRSGKVDLVIGSSRDWHPEIKTQSLFTSTFQALVRPGHPIIGQVTPETLTHYPHISVSPRAHAGADRRRAARSRPAAQRRPDPAGLPFGDDADHEIRLYPAAAAPRAAGSKQHPPAVG